MFKILLLGLLIMIDTHANKLEHEDSPYLQQHAHNPVHWYPWGDEAFLKAKKEDKLIFLSIGYSTCHWCHVMEKESFENKSVAKILNQNFIAIKVDREEYPHIDRHYQDIYALMNRRGGGWPLTIVMTPERRVFFSATYMPADDQYGRAGLKGMLKVLHDAYHDRRQEVVKSAASIEAAMQRMDDDKESQEVKTDLSIAENFVKEVAQSYDSKNSGIGTAPKFPHASTLDTLLDIYRINGSQKAQQMAYESLLAMSRGGIYDQIEGGFYRYSTDERWMIPHFEKMLYTNAELISAYANAYALSKEERFKRVIAQTVHNIHERFYHDGLYYSASDADSDGEEGKYFVFDYKDALKSLKAGGFSDERAKRVLDYLGIFAEGNFEDNQSNPYLTSKEVPKDLDKALGILRQNRAAKKYPFIDYKVQTSWNALYISALLKAGKMVDKSYHKEALHALDSLLSHLYIDGTLYHQIIVGKKPKVAAYLEDYAFLIDALIAGYEVSFDADYLKVAQKLLDEGVRGFYKEGRWYMSDDAFKAKAAFYDASYRSAMAIMIENIFKIALLSDNIKLYHFGLKSLQSKLAALKQSPSHYPTGMKVLLESLSAPIVLKSSVENLQANRERIDQITYPFVLLKPSSDRHFLACKIDRCFAVDESLEEVIKKIEKE